MKILKMLSLIASSLVLVSSLLGCDANIETPVPPVAEKNSGVIDKSIEGNYANSSAENADPLHGFELSSSGVLQDVNANTKHYIHKKTGAEALFIKNEDPLIVFAMAFNTLPDDDTGKAAIVKNAITASSKKYPAANLFADSAKLFSSGYDSVVSKSSTYYFQSSKDHAQALNLADMLLSCTLNASFVNDANYLAKEGWHYELESSSGELSQGGSGYLDAVNLNSSIDFMAHQNVFSTLYPNTHLRYQIYGNPEKISALSQEDLVDFYKKHYTPSNSISIIYGNAQEEPFLSLMDSYFENASGVLQSPVVQEPLKKRAVKVYQFPAKKTDLSYEDGVIAYGFALDSLTSANPERLMAVELLVDLLNDPSSDFMKELVETKIASSYRVDLSVLKPNTTVVFYANDVNPRKAGDFSNTVLNQIKKYIKNGFSPQEIQSSITKKKFDAQLIKNSQTFTKDLIVNAVNAFMVGDYSYIDKTSLLDSLETTLSSSYLQALLDKIIVSNKHCALVTTAQKPGLVEKNIKDTEKAFAKAKSNLTKQQLDDALSYNQNIQNWEENLDNLQSYKNISAVALKDINTTLPTQKITDETVNNVRLISAEVPKSTVSKTTLRFNVSHLTSEELLLLNLYLQILGGATDDLSANQVKLQTDTLLNNLTATLNINEKDGKLLPITADVSFIALEKTFDKALDLVFNLILNTSTLQNIENIDYYLTGMKSYYANPTNYQAICLNNTLAYSMPSKTFSQQLFGTDFQKSIKSFRTDIKISKKNFATKIDKVLEKAFVKNGASILRLGDWVYYASAKELILKAINTLPTTTSPALERELLTPKKRTAFVGDVAFGYITSAVDLNSRNANYTGENILLDKIVQDLHLIPNITTPGYALNTYATSNPIYKTFESYGVLNFTATLQAIENIPTFLHSFEFNQQLLDSYKLSAINTFLQSSGSLNDTQTIVDNWLIGYTPTDMQKVMNQITTATVISVKAAIPNYLKLIQENPYSAVIPTQQSKAVKNYFDTQITLPN